MEPAAARAPELWRRSAAAAGAGSEGVPGGAPRGVAVPDDALDADEQDAEEAEAWCYPYPPPAVVGTEPPTAAALRYARSVPWEAFARAAGGDPDRARFRGEVQYVVLAGADRGSDQVRSTFFLDTDGRHCMAFSCEDPGDVESARVLAGNVGCSAGCTEEVYRGPCGVAVMDGRRRASVGFPHAYAYVFRTHAQAAPRLRRPRGSAGDKHGGAHL